MKKILISSILILFSFCSQAQGQMPIGKTTARRDALIDFGSEVRGLVLAPIQSVNAMLASPGTIVFDGGTGSFRYLNNSGTWSPVVSGGDIGGVQSGVGLNQILIGTTSSTAKGFLILGKDVGETKALVLPKLSNGNLRFNNPVAGLIYYDTVLKSVMVFNGNSWTRF